MGRQPVVKSLVDMTQLVRAVVEELALASPTRDRLDLRVGDLPPAFGDPGMLREVLANLLSKALKYSRGRTPAVVEIGARSEDGEIVYFVKDNGVGFDMQYAHKLFGVFERLHSAEEFEGTGVGLALVKRIIDRHGGCVWGEGRPGAGATFAFTLPPGAGLPAAPGYSSSRT